MDTKMARFRVDASQETGELVLLIETQSGFRPVMGWPDAGSFKEFTEMLVGICVRIDKKNDRVREISEKLLKQALGDGPESE